MMPRDTAPELEGDALRAVQHRGSHLQIIAAAGSGKTEVVSQRVVDLLANGSPANSIVAFTFTERAADELKSRIVARVEERLGPGALDSLGGLFVGTIHSFCFRLLQRHELVRFAATWRFDGGVLGRDLLFASSGGTLESPSGLPLEEVGIVPPRWMVRLR